MSSTHRLRESLLRALYSQDSHDNEQELFDQLMVQKPHLLKLFDFGPRNPQEQKEIESGKPVIHGRATAINADFARQAIFLSQQLELSEKYVAETLHNVLSSNPNVTPISSIEMTVASHHQRRRDLVDSIILLLDATEAAEALDASPIYKRLAHFFRTQILPGTRTPTGEVTLPQKMFKEIEQLDVVIGKADAAKKNAGSNTVAPTGQNNPALGADVLIGRYDSLRYERRNLGVALCSVARLGYILSNEIKLIVDWLAANSNHPMVYYMLTAIFITLDPIDPDSVLSPGRQHLSTDNALVTFMSKKLEPSAAWKDPALKATVLLKWTLFLTEARHNDSTLEHRDGFKTDELETHIWNAVQGDAFKYLAQSVMHVEAQTGRLPSPSILEKLPSDQQDLREVPPPEFKIVVLSSFETLLRSLINYASSELRKIKQRQEDVVLASARTDRNRLSSRFPSSHPPPTEQPESAPRQDIALLYSFIGLLYSALPSESAIQFWGSGPSSRRPTFQEAVETTSGRLPAFLQWAVWSTPSQDLTMLAALYDMLSGLANGEQCSELAYNFMARSGGEVLSGSSVSSSSTSGPSVSWSVIFGILETWAANSSNSRNQQQAQPRAAASTTFGTSFQNLAPPPQAPAEFVISAHDVLFARSFLRMLSTVVSHSVAVRKTIAGHGHFRAIPALISLIPLGIPLELKGAIFDTLSSFCEPGAGVAGVEICKAVWTLMERVEVINVRLAPAAGFGLALVATRGVEMELEEVESTHRLYPSTIPFLKLLSTLIHTPKQLSSQELTTAREPLNTIPETLGQPYRLPGIAPFTNFVVDTVFANIPNRDYTRSSDRWQINDLCLTFIERSLAGFDLESLVTAPDEAPLKLENIVPLLVHPGYDIMKRMLTSTPLQSTVLAYIVDGLEGFERGFSIEEPFFRTTITRVLRIVLRVLEIQDIFLDVFIPLLADFNSVPYVGQVYSRSYFIRFDQALAFGSSSIPAIATYMAYPAYPEVVLLSVKIIAKLSLSTSPSTLITLIQRSPESERILDGFAKIMSTESMDNVAQAEEDAERLTGAGSPAINTSTDSLEQAIRLAALNLLIQDTETKRSYPNIAHFLLFGGKGTEQKIQDPHALGARQTSIHVLLDLVNAGIPRLKAKRERESSQAAAIPLFTALPELAERCYRLIYQLCVHRQTTDFTCRYLRSREDFFARQLARVPSHAPETLQAPAIQLQYTDGSRETTTVTSLSSFLRLRSYIFDLVALELHVLTNKGLFKAVSELLEILFGTDTEVEEDYNFSTFHELGQSPMRMIDFLQSLMFDWADSLSVEHLDMDYLRQINLQSCVRKDASGCEVVDRTALVYLLSVGKATLHAQGAVATQAQNDKLNAEILYVLGSCAVENHRRQVSYARETSFEAWRRLLDLALTKCFDRLPHNRRENMLFDLLHVLPATMQSGNIEESTSVLLSETILSSITKLREDRQQQVILQSLGGDSESGSLPAERLHTILRNIQEIILDSNHVELVRGNLYAALINLFNLIRAPHDVKLSSEAQLNPFGASLAYSTLKDSTMLRNPSVAASTSRNRTTASTSLELSCLNVMKPALERLIGTISRDAIDGTEVWKTVAFMLLDAMVQLSSLEKQHPVLSFLNRHGVLTNFVHSIKDSDLRLQGVLKPDPEDLNSLYVYEAKMSLFIRMAQNRAGAERLLESQLLPILAQCDYLDTRPEADQAFIDQDSFLPPAIQRYHQLLMPALQVVDGIVATLSTRHTTATQQALNFLSTHGSTIAILLKNEDDYVTLPTLEEVHLIIALCTNILPSVPETEVLSPNSGFGAIHHAILGLSTRCLGRGKTFMNIVPQSDTDIMLSQAIAFGHGSMSNFEVKAQRKERLLCKSVIAYIGAAADFTEPEITLVLSPVTIRPRNEERMAHFAATIPTVGDALVALDTLCGDFSTTLKQIADIGAELANKGRMGPDSANEVLREIDPTLLRDLTPSQKQALLARELGATRDAAVDSARVLLSALEMLLLLLWRHVAYYTAPGSPPVQATVGNALRLLASTDPEGFQREVGARVGALVGKIQGLDVDGETFGFGREWEDNRGYLEIMCRRLKDSAGLQDEDRGGGTAVDGDSQYGA